MAKTRKFVSYRTLAPTAYTRTSKYRAKSYIRMTKNPRIVRWHMGEKTTSFPYKVQLICKNGLQIRDLAIESARMTSNRHMEKSLGKEGWHMHLFIYPHHILRENALASGAGADRLSTGMARPFGKPIGIAARIYPGQVILEIHVPKTGLDIAKMACKRAKAKLPGSYMIQTVNREAPIVAKKPATKVVKKSAVKAAAKKAAETPAQE